MRCKTMLGAAILLLGLSTPAAAVDEPENVIAYRQSVMKAINGHAGAIVAVVKGQVSFVDHVAAHARGINAMSKLIPGIFPKGTDNLEYSDTRALPDIWQDWPRFETAAKTLERESAKLVEVAEGGGDVAAIGAQLQKVGEACGSCHKPFRAEKN